MDHWAGLLQIAIFLPTAGALVIVLGTPRDPRAEQLASRWTALLVVLITFAAAVALIARFPAGAEEFAVSDGASWFGDSGGVDIRFSLGLDGLSLWLFGLASLLMIPAVAVSWKAVDRHCRTYYALLLVLETGMLGLFCARDILLFYVLFEASSIPLFFLIGIWGTRGRREAAVRFILFTLAGSLLTFLGLLAIVWWHFDQSGVLSFSIPALTEGLVHHPPLPPRLQLAVFVALFAGFAVRVPLFPLHAWFPSAQAEATAGGSVVLAGVALKTGAYGFLRFSLPMLPDATVLAMPWLLGLAVAGVVYGALAALAQTDMKRLIAYLSVSHLGLCVLGIFTLTRPGIQGGLLQTVNHGLSTGGLFALVGMLRERCDTNAIQRDGGIARRLPVLASLMLLMSLASIGLPGLNGFAGKFLVLTGIFQRAWAQPGAAAVFYRTVAVLAPAGAVLVAWCMLRMIARVFFGSPREPAFRHTGNRETPIADLSVRELAGLVPLIVFIFWIGIQPSFFLQRMAPTLDRLAAESIQRADRGVPHAANDRLPAAVVTEGESARDE